MSSEKKRILILGCGFSGISFLLKMNELAKESISMTVIEPRVNVLNRPTMPEVAFEHKQVDHAMFPVESIVKHHDINWINKSAKTILPDENKVELDDGAFVEYDYLYVATGGKKDYDAIEGFHEFGYSLCDEEQASRLAVAVENFNGGPVYVGAAYTEFDNILKDVPSLGAPCEGPVGEAMFMMYHRIKLKGLTESSPIYAFTPGEIFFEDVGKNIHKAFGPLLESTGIQVHNNKKVKKVGKDFIEFEDGTKEKSALSIVIPPYKAQEVCKNIGDKKGFVPVDANMKHIHYDNIYCGGDASARIQPKLGHLAVMSGNVAASHIAFTLTNIDNTTKYDPEVFCIMNRSGGEATMLRSNSLYGGDIDTALSGKIAHLMKWSFDLYFGFTNGHMPPKFMEDIVKKFLEIKSNKENKDN